MATDFPRGNPPTAAEIKTWLGEFGTFPKSHPQTAKLRDLIADWAAAINSPAFDALEATDPRDPADVNPEDLWCDLRPTEAIRLRDLVDAGVGRAFDRCQEAILEELLVAARAFALEYPEAPRPPAVVQP